MSEKIRLCLRLKSGKEFCFSCDKYKITKSNVTGELLELTYEGGFGECSIYFGLNDVESISKINTEESKTGKGVILDECANGGIYCSRCHKKVLKIDYSNTMKHKNFKFCPNCGADMRGEKNE